MIHISIWEGGLELCFRRDKPAKAPLWRLDCVA